ncbi:MAG: acetyltransferase [Desulfobacterales bacterium SG8_35_2]|nr:MAG: acetyltransferase [Desulfobacterales bacterium SG8_35_2]
MKKENLILVGGGGHARSCIDVIEMSGQYSIAGIVDLPERVHEKILGYEIIATDKDLPELAKQYNNFFISVGQILSPTKRLRIFDALNGLKVNMPVIISPRAYVSAHANIGKGTIVMHGALVNAGSVIGDNCIINSNALVEHDCRIGNHCHISTGALINGGVSVGDASFIGSGTVCNETISIGKKSIISSKSNVAKDLPDNSLIRK